MTQRVREVLAEHEAGLTCDELRALLNEAPDTAEWLASHHKKRLDELLRRLLCDRELDFIDDRFVTGPAGRVDGGHTGQRPTDLPKL